MSTTPDPLSWFTPLPPARNGIADYAAILLGEVARIEPCVCYCEDPCAAAPEDVEVRDPLQAFRYLGPGSRILHQVGNNGGHVFALDALRRHGGVVTLHDLSLLYVYELANTRPETLFGHMQSPAPALGTIFAQHWKGAGLKTAANYVLFDMIGEVLRRADAVIVHSDYAARKIRATHGAAAGGKIEVIPHFARADRPIPYPVARERLGLGPDDKLILTSGFATRSKRFDWLIEALAELRRRGQTFLWIHAGQERSDEYPLSDSIQRAGLGDVARVTGYLSEEHLDSTIAAADVVVNLRFPSVGESSGTLARAFAAGRCCIVNDTGAYAEIPRDAVVHIPVFGTVPALVRALDRLLVDPDLRDTFGQRSATHARTNLGLDTIARRYLRVFEDHRQAAVASSGPDRRPSEPLRLAYEVDRTLPDLSGVLAPGTREFELTLWFASADALAEATVKEPALVASLVGPHVGIDSIRFVQASADRRRPTQEKIGIRVAGTAF